MTGYVYFVTTAGCFRRDPIKIGHSAAPELRTEQIEAWSPFPLELLCTIEGGKDLERNIQNCFADCHYHHEWFYPAHRLVAAIEALREGTPLREAIDLSDVRGSVLGQTQRATMKRNGTKATGAAAWRSRRAA